MNDEAQDNRMAITPKAKGFIVFLIGDVLRAYGSGGPSLMR